MGFFDRLFGREEAAESTQPQYRRSGASSPQRTDDEIAVERYRYLLRTAPPETIEEVHREAFAKLTPEQRTVLFDQLTANAPAGDKPQGQDPESLATSATRSEIRQPGTMERSMAGGAGGGMGFGSMMASSLLGTVAGYVIGSALMSSFLPDGAADASADAGGDGDVTSASGDSGDSGGDFGGGDFGGGFGGGDFGGGDFGGGGDF
jgi:hypothetical protein